MVGVLVVGVLVVGVLVVGVLLYTSHVHLTWFVCFVLCV